MICTVIFWGLKDGGGIYWDNSAYLLWMSKWRGPKLNDLFGSWISHLLVFIGYKAVNFCFSISSVQPTTLVWHLSLQFSLSLPLLLLFFALHMTAWGAVHIKWTTSIKTLVLHANHVVLPKYNVRGLLRSRLNLILVLTWLILTLRSLLLIRLLPVRWYTSKAKNAH